MDSDHVRIALKNSNIDMVDYLIGDLKVKFDLNDLITYGTDYLISKYFKIDEINLMMMVLKNEVEIIKHICSTYPEYINKQNRNGQTMLMEAARSNLYIFDMLSKYNADPTITDNDGFNIMYYLLSNNKDSDDMIYIS